MQLKKKITLIKNLQPIIIPTNIDPKLGSGQKSISPLKTLAHIQGFHPWVKHKNTNRAKPIVLFGIESYATISFIWYNYK